MRQMLMRKLPLRRNRFLHEEKKAAFTIDPRWQEITLQVLWVVCGIAFGVLAFPVMEKQMNQPVNKIVVTGNFHFVDHRDIMARIPVYEGDRLLDVDLDAVQAGLEHLPWVYSARVSRRWPDVINISIVEQKPIALWNATQVLNQYGQVFDRNDKETKALPALLGLPGSELDVIERFREFSQLLAPFGLKIVRLQQDEQLAWDVETDNGIRLRLGATQALEKMQRFVFLYQAKLQHETRAVAIVDLRYNNGAAVSWKDTVPGNNPAISSASNVQKKG
jgi:cell division protein FtsQ